ncbi:hypothetical protein HYFRA_00011793 [Hymenoscyphus fraxineus]|uniref:Uncharacterized protein n=1 Tax=Hymenoscyphus fraxineus TaxID=746836 RepID=A0A9N9L8C6_9HELO|nr:hypothetical protein HYFRA_00011793 [Hymenoscyphus fraxineus]
MDPTSSCTSGSKLAGSQAQQGTLTDQSKGLSNATSLRYLVTVELLRKRKLGSPENHLTKVSISMIDAQHGYPYLVPGSILFFDVARRTVIVGPPHFVRISVGDPT